MKPADDPSWDSYYRTRLELLEDRSMVVDLARPISAGTFASLLALGVGPTFAVLTACNPRGRLVNVAENIRLLGLLVEELYLLGLASVPTDGVSPDGLHREVGVAVSLDDKEAAAELARKYGQSAFYWFDGADMWLVGGLVEVADRRLPWVP
jgi:hypothetical protein